MARSEVRSETVNASIPHRRMLRRGVAATVAALLGVAVTVIVPGVAQADGPTTFSNTAAISIPASGAESQIGAASPYPSSIVVSGMAGVVTAVDVVLHGVSHTVLNDVDALLVAPSGENLVILSDVGDTALAFANNVTLTLSDPGAATVPAGTVATDRDDRHDVGHAHDDRQQCDLHGDGDRGRKPRVVGHRHVQPGWHVPSRDPPGDERCGQRRRGRRHHRYARRRASASVRARWR